MSRFAPGTDLSIYEPDSLRGGRPVLKNKEKKNVGIGGGPGIPPRFPGRRRRRREPPWMDGSSPKRPEFPWGGVDDPDYDKKKREYFEKKWGGPRPPKRSPRVRPPERSPGIRPPKDEPRWGINPPRFDVGLPGPPGFYDRQRSGWQPSESPNWKLPENPNWQSSEQDTIQPDFLKENFSKYTEFLNILKAFKGRR